MTKLQRIKELARIILEPDSNDLRDMPVKESVANIGTGILVMLIIATHLILSLWQFAVSILLVGYDLVIKMLVKAMPSPKIKEL